MGKSRRKMNGVSIEEEYLLLAGSPAKEIDLYSIIGSRRVGESPEPKQSMDTSFAGILAFLVVSTGCFWLMMIKRVMTKMTSATKNILQKRELYPEIVYLTPFGEKYHLSKSCPTLAASKIVKERPLCQQCKNLQPMLAQDGDRTCLRARTVPLM